MFWVKATARLYMLCMPCSVNPNITLLIVFRLEIIRSCHLFSPPRKSKIIVYNLKGPYISYLNFFKSEAGALGIEPSLRDQRWPAHLWFGAIGLCGLPYCHSKAPAARKSWKAVIYGVYNNLWFSRFHTQWHPFWNVQIRIQAFWTSLILVYIVARSQKT